jgi:hypothetical protein
LGQICIKFVANLAPKLKINYAGSAPSNGAILDEFNYQYWCKSIKNSTKFNAQLALFWCKKCAY